MTGATSHQARLACLGIMCALATFLSSLSWSLITPPFQAPDEPSHFAYVQRLAETGRPPSPSEVNRPPWSSEQAAALRALRFPSVRGNPLGKPPWTAMDQRLADRELVEGLRQDDGGGAEAASTYPPLYYSIQAVPYLAADGLGANVIERLAVMRVASALMAALTALFVFMFVRELIPSSALAAVAGSLGVGLLPYVGFIGGSVNNDGLMMLLSAALFWLLARSFRRGLGPAEAAGVAAIAVLGWATKPTLLGLVPGAMLGVGVLLFRRWQLDRKAAAKSLAAFLASGLGLCALYFGLTQGFWQRTAQPPGPGQFIDGSNEAGQPDRSPAGLVSYAWQYWLPRPWFLTDQVAEPYPLWETMFKGFVGRFGWLEYQFPASVYFVVLAAWSGLIALAVRALVVARATLQHRVVELACYVIMAMGVLALISSVGYDLRLRGDSFEQARYLFPLLALFGGLVGMAVKGAGQRLGPYLAVLVVVGTGALDLAGLLITVGRYYA